MKTLQADLNIQLLFIDKCRLTVLCTENWPPILPLLFAALVKYRKSMKHKRAISPKHRHRIIGSNVRLDWRNILIIIGTPLRTPIASSRCSASWGSARETERGKKENERCFPCCVLTTRAPGRGYDTEVF